MPAIPEIHGRTLHSDRAATTITITDKYGERAGVIHGGTLHQRESGEFLLTAKHPTATDVEHDSSYVAYFEGAGLRFDGMTAGSVTLSGSLFSANFWDDPEEHTTGACDMCKEPHGYLPFTPPKRDWAPGFYHFKVKYHQKPAEG